jgi:hypothetical protein
MDRDGSMAVVLQQARLLTSHGPLAGVGNRSADGRASSGGHLRSQSRGEDTGGGHCD